MHEDLHENESSQTRLGIAFFMTAAFMAVEVAGGLLFNSLALLADAGHMLSDVLALGLAWIALQIGKRSPTDRHTFGFKRTEILAGLLNGLALWVIVAVIFYEAALRFSAPEPVKGAGMLAIASIGLVVNIVMAGMLFQSRHENLNIKGAFLHVISDGLGSVGAIVAAVIIIMTGMYWVDPLVSVLIGCLVLYSSWGLVKESVHILMEGVPLDLNIREIEDSITHLDGVCCVYDLHIWSITTNRNALSAHVVLSDPDYDRNLLLTRLRDLLKTRFLIDHSTIQIESGHEMRPDAEGLRCRAGTACV